MTARLASALPTGERTGGSRRPRQPRCGHREPEREGDGERDLRRRSATAEMCDRRREVPCREVGAGDPHAGAGSGAGARLLGRATASASGAFSHHRGNGEALTWRAARRELEEATHLHGAAVRRGLAGGPGVDARGACAAAEEGLRRVPARQARARDVDRFPSARAARAVGLAVRRGCREALSLAAAAAGHRRREPADLVGGAVRGRRARARRGRVVLRVGVVMVTRVRSVTCVVLVEVPRIGTPATVGPAIVTAASGAARRCGAAARDRRDQEQRQAAERESSHEVRR